MIVIARILITVLLFLIGAIAQSQSINKKIVGKVITTVENQESIHVVNISLGKATTTDKYGSFIISVGLNDTLVFSAVQLEKQIIIITEAIWNEEKLNVPMYEAINQLDEVIIKPYGLSGNLNFDTRTLETLPIITASTLDLPNANVKKLSQSERRLYSASRGIGPLALVNVLTGYTKELKGIVERDKKYEKTVMVEGFFSDTIYLKELGLSENRIGEFLYFCELDPLFQKVVDSEDRLELLEYLKKKSKMFGDDN